MSEDDDKKIISPEKPLSKTSFAKRYFDITLPTDGRMGVSMGLIGASRSGKSTFLKYMYKTHFKKHVTTLFSQNTHADIYKDFGKNVITCDT
jgi:ABC-type phosphate/phosphonate transport system ATPase subunit